jgi:hypothetical protein
LLMAVSAHTSGFRLNNNPAGEVGRVRARLPSFTGWSLPGGRHGG